MTFGCFEAQLPFTAVRSPKESPKKTPVIQLAGMNDWTRVICRSNSVEFESKIIWVKNYHEICMLKIHSFLKFSPNFLLHKLHLLQVVFPWVDPGKPGELQLSRRLSIAFKKGTEPIQAWRSSKSWQRWHLVGFISPYFIHVRIISYLLKVRYLHQTKVCILNVEWD